MLRNGCGKLFYAVFVKYFAGLIPVGLDLAYSYSHKLAVSGFLFYEVVLEQAF